MNKKIAVALGLALAAVSPSKARAACADHDGPLAPELGALFAEAAAQAKTAGRELGAACCQKPSDAPAAAQTAKQGVFFRENPDFTADWDFTASHTQAFYPYPVSDHAEGKLVEAVDVEDVPGFGKPSLYPDFRKNYEEALRENR